MNFLEELESVADEVEYKDIPEFTGYRVGSDGSVWSRWEIIGNKDFVLTDYWYLLKMHPDKDGYLRVSLQKEKIRSILKVHHLVLITFKNCNKI